MYGYVIGKDGYKRYENPFMCYKSSVSNQTVYNRFRLAAFAVPHIYKIYTIYVCFVCFTLSVSLCTTYSPPLGCICTEKKRRKKNGDNVRVMKHTHFYCWLSFVRNVFFFSRYEANAKWIQMNSAKRKLGGWKMRRANIHKCICVYVYSIVCRMGISYAEY